MTPTIAEKRRRFAELHQAPGCFVMPNPFDVGSAKYLASLGFPALATTSAGMAFAAGRPDGGGRSRLCAEPHSRPRRRDRSPAQCGFRGRLRDATPRASMRARGFASAPASPAFRSRITPATATRRSYAVERSGRAIARRARGDQRQRRNGPLDRAQRGDPARGRRPDRGAATARRLRGSRRRCALRAAIENDGGGRRSRPGRGQAAGQRAGRLAGLHPSPARGPRRQAHQRRRRARPRRLGRDDARGERHRGERTVRRVRRACPRRREIEAALVERPSQ